MYLGIDLGTTGLKCVMFETDGTAVAVADTTESNKDSVQSAIDGCPVSAISQGE